MAVARVGEPAGERMGQRDGGRHERRRLVAGIAVHDALVARTEFASALDALRDVGGLRADELAHGAGGGVEAERRAHVPDAAHHVAGHTLNVERGRRGDLPGDGEAVAAGKRLHGHAGVGVIGQAGVEDGV